MANITKRKNKNGSVSYLIRVYVDETGTGHQIVKSMTWKPKPGMRPSAEEKELNKRATLFEEQVKQGLTAFGGSTRFGDYARDWIKLQPLAPKTRELYEGLMDRIDKAIGHIRLDKLNAHHLELFYKNLSEPGMNLHGNYAVSHKLNGILQKREIKKAELARLAGVSEPTAGEAAREEHLRIEKAEAICKALDLPLVQVFEIHKSTAKLTGNTIAHYHRFISAVLMTAKKQRLIPFNVASEQCTPPKIEHKEARFLTDEQARTFLELLLKEPDIRIKTSLALLLFTGLRRGELLGLEWPDINMEKQTIHVQRASQVQKGVGVTEAPTKNESSMRSVKVSDFVIGLLMEYHVWWNEKRLQNGENWRGKQERLFIQDDGRPLYPDTINYWMDKFLKKHNFKHFTPHSLRHTFCTLELAAGVDYRTLQSMSGHAQASTLVNIYGHALESAQNRAADVLAQTLLPQSKKTTG